MAIFEMLVYQRS